MFPELEYFDNWLYVRNYPSSIEHLKKFKNFKEIYFASWTHCLEKNTIYEIFKNNPNLEDISMDILNEEIMMGLFTLKSLKNVTIFGTLNSDSENKITIEKNSDSEEIFMALSKNNTIKRLTIDCNEQKVHSLSNFEKCFEFMDTNKTLHSINFGLSFDEKSMLEFSTKMKTNTNVILLNWKDCDCSFLKDNITLTNLTLFCSQQERIDSFYEGMIKNNTLKILKLFGTNWADSEVSSFAKIMENNTSVEELYFECSRNTFKEIPTVLKNNRTIKKLIFDNCHIYNCDKIFDSLKDNQCISEIEISSWSFSAEVPLKISQKKFDNNLKSFIARTPADFSADLTFLNSLIGQKSLEVLILNEVKLGTKFINNLSKSLENESNLITLSLDDHLICKEYKSFFNGIKMNNTLKKLDLLRLKMSSEMLSFLFDCINQNTTLEELLVNVDIPFKECEEELCKFIQNNRKIKNLQFSCEKIGFINSHRKIFESLEMNYSLISFSVCVHENKRKHTISTPNQVSHANHIGYETIDKYKEKYNYDEFMESPTSLIRKYFKKCLENQFCPEGFYFHESVESYRSLKTEDDLRNHAMYIKENFLVPNSRYEVNTSGKLKIEIYEFFEIDEYPLTLFDNLDKDILHNIRMETYEKFLQSNEFQEFLKEQDGIEQMIKGKVVNTKDIQNFLKTTNSSTDSPRANYKKGLTSNLMKSMKKKKDSSSPKVKISGPVTKVVIDSSEDFTDIFNFEEILADKNNEIRFNFKLFLEKYGPEMYLFYLHENIEDYRTSNPNFIFSKDESPKAIIESSPKKSPISPLENSVIVKSPVRSPEVKDELKTSASTAPVSPKKRELPKIPPQTPRRVTKNSIIRTNVKKELPKIPPKINKPNSHAQETKISKNELVPKDHVKLEKNQKNESTETQLTEETVQSKITKEIKQSIEIIKEEFEENDKTPMRRDFKFIALQIKEQFFDMNAKHFIERKDLHCIKFEDIKFYKMDLFDELDEKIIKILKKEHFAKFVKSEEFIKLLKESPSVFLSSQSTPSSPMAKTLENETEEIRPKSFEAAVDTPPNEKTPRKFELFQDDSTLQKVEDPILTSPKKENSKITSPKTPKKSPLSIFSKSSKNVNQTSPSTEEPKKITRKNSLFGFGTAKTPRKNPEEVQQDAPKTPRSKKSEKQPIKEVPRLKFYENQKEEIFKEIIEDSTSPYRVDFKEYLELTSSSQILNLHESIEFYRFSNQNDRKIQSMVLQKIMGASAKTKHLLNSDEMKVIQENMNESPVELYDDLDQKIVTTLQKFYYNQYFMIQCEKFLYE
eukprot:gene2109-1976_t